MRHIVNFSGGLGSWAAAKRVVERHGTKETTLLFADTRMEDYDLYRFLVQAAGNVGAPLVVIADGRTPWQVFEDEKFIGNTRIDLCSRVLKRNLLDAWIADNCDPSETTVYVGISWDESHRFFGRGTKPGLEQRRREQGWRYQAPLCDKPYLTKEQLREWLSREGIKLPRLYELDFPHNNCGGFCVKAGHAHFRHLLQVLPEVYAFHEGEEQRLREVIGRDDIGILRDRRGGKTKSLTLKDFRERIEQEEAPPNPLECDEEWGGCGCAID